MVKTMEDAIKVDKQGRLVLPSNVRKAFGIKDGGEVTIRIDGSRVVLEPVRKDVKKSVQEWEDLSRSLKAEVFTDEASESWKWMSREYARRKLGLS
jgi:AbrB family looped-hinge helix DNA binding protein